MKPIPEGIVEKTWQEMAGFNPDTGKREMTKIGNIQPDLLAFVMESPKEMSQEVRELAIYIFLVAYRVFEKAHAEIKKISSVEIVKCYEHNEALVDRLEGAHERFLDRIASLQTSKQPHVGNYVVDALMEENETEGAVTLTEEQKGFLYLPLKTVIDVLDQSGIE